MSSRSVRPRRAITVLAPIVLIATLLSTGSLSGQGDETGPLAVAVSSQIPLPAASVTVLGDGLVAAPLVSPLSPTSTCATSLNGPTERAAAASTDTVVTVDNLACLDASLTTIAQDLSRLDEATDVVVVGGTALEFDWPALAAQCLDSSTRSAAGCQLESTAARANAANSFFSWRSLLQQAHLRAPDATLVLLSPPTPVGTTPLPLGSQCCSTRLDGHELVRSVFNTASSVRRAVVESTADLPVVVVDSEDAFVDHRLDDDDSWLSRDSAAFGTPTADGAQALADLIDVLMPVGESTEPPALTPSEIVLVLGTTRADVASHEAIRDGAADWLAQYRDSNVQASVAIVQASTSAVEAPPETTTTTTTTVPDTEPVGEDSAVVELPTDADADPPAEPAEVDPTLDVEPEIDVDEQTEAEVDGEANVEVGVEVEVEANVEAETPLAGRVLQADQAPPIAQFATTAEDLGDAIDAIDIADGVTSVSNLTDALADAQALFTPTVDRQVIVRVENLDVANATVEEFAQLTLAIGALDNAAVTLLAPSDDLAVDLEDALDGTGAVLTAASTLELAIALPAPTPPPVLQDVSVRNIEATAATPAPVAAGISSARPDEPVEVRWLADGELIAAGQRTELPTEFLGLGDHEIVVTVATRNEQLSSIFTLRITADGDGIQGDSCPNDFDPFSVDLDGDGLGEACDDDDDNDGLPDAIDPCRTTASDNLNDIDLDGLPDHCDGDPLDGPGADFDGDGFADQVDNCPTVSQNDLFDADHDGIGNACDNTTLGAPCTIVGTVGDDTIVGTEGNDVICGLGGDDRISGLGGNDIIFAGAGNDLVFAGGGNDTVYGGAGDDELLGNGNDDVLLGEAGNDELSGGFGSDVVSGARGVDVIDGGAGPDVIFGGRGHDTLDGNDGRDAIDGGRGNDSILGGDGNDLLVGGPGRDSVLAGRGNDRILNVESSDFVSGEAGTDLIDGSPIRIN